MTRRQVVVIATSVGAFAAVVGWLVEPAHGPALLLMPVAAIVLVAVVVARRGDGR